MELKTPRFDLYSSGNENHKVVVYSRVLARALNRITKTYDPKDFQEDDEPMFVFHNSLLPRVLKVLGVSDEV